MIRNTLLAISLFGFTAGSAFAGTPAATHHTSRTVAQAPAGDTAAPAEKPAKKEKKAKKEKADKGAKEAAPKSEGAKDMKAPEAK